MSATVYQNSTLSTAANLARGSDVSGAIAIAESTPPNSILSGVQNVKEALSAKSGGLSDAELNVLAHAITQLTAAFSVQQAFSANVASFAQLEKALDALEELLEEVEKAKTEMKEGLATMMISEAVSAVIGGLMTAKSLDTAVRQFRYTKFANNVSSQTAKAEVEVSVTNKGTMPAAGPKQSPSSPSKTPKTETPQTGVDAQKKVEANTTAAKKAEVKRQENADDASVNSAKSEDSVDTDPDAQSVINAENKAFENEAAAQTVLERMEAPDGWTMNPLSASMRDSKTLKMLPSKADLATINPDTATLLGRHAEMKAGNLGTVVQIELQASRIVQQFAHSFKSIGETQQSLAQVELQADQSVYSNQTEYLTTLMGIFQRLSQEYQSAFQSDYSTLGQDVSQANMMAQYVYRS